MEIINVIRKEKEKTIVYILKYIHKNNDKVLNIGSSSTTFGEKCINLDIQRCDGIDLMADAHKLPFVSESFNICILSAVLQYCRDPFQVVKEVHRVLLPGGVAIIDAPFIQQYCLGTLDLYRFSIDGLKTICSRHLDIIRCEVSISAGSALAFYLQGIISVLVSNKYMRFISAQVVSLIVFPLSFLKFKNRHEIAGAFILLARKRIE
jgi:SAM-dependent methyltransferase